jgi:hypothetical protein
MPKHNRSHSIDLTLGNEEIKNKSLKINTQDDNKVKKRRRHSLTPTAEKLKSFTFEVEEQHKPPKKQQMINRQKSGINISLHEKNKDVNHKRHFCLCLITCGIWIPCWMGACCCNCCYQPCDF